MNMPVVQFDILTPLNADHIAANIVHACSLGLPDFDDADLKTLTVIANGPSARLYDFAHIQGDTMALNGAGSLFPPRHPPTYWAVCDPQVLVADFFKDPPLRTIYLVASKCDPLVFQMLQGRDVRLWHIDDHPIPNAHRSVSCASSVTLTAMTLMRKHGYRHFETWGWDACFYDTEHHAGQHVCDFPDNTIDLNVGGTLKDEEITGGRWFKTTTTWAAEAQDAVTQISHCDYSITLNGDGLIKAILDCHGIGTKPLPKSPEQP